MKKFRFVDWKVYRDAKALFSLLIKIVNRLPREYRFEVGSQLIRSGLSVVLNIAEGSGKGTDKELNRFFDIALGSLFEVFATVDVLRDNTLVQEIEYKQVQEYVSGISDQLGGFKKSINQKK